MVEQLELFKEALKKVFLLSMRLNNPKYDSKISRTKVIDLAEVISDKIISSYFWLGLGDVELLNKQTLILNDLFDENNGQEISDWVDNITTMFGGRYREINSEINLELDLITEYEDESHYSIQYLTQKLSTKFDKLNLTDLELTYANSVISGYYSLQGL